MKRHYCNYSGPEIPRLFSEQEEDYLPSVLSIGDLHSDMTTPSTACTTYFTNMELAEEEDYNNDRPVHSLVYSWQPPVNSTMIKQQQHSSTTCYSSGTATDSGFAGQESNDLYTLSCDSHMTSCHKPTMQDISDDRELLLSVQHESRTRPSPSPPVANLTPPSRYNAAANICNGLDPINKDLIRRKNILKAKINVDKRK